MSEAYRFVKSPKSFTCSCGVKVPAKTYRIEHRLDKSCLNCGSRILKNHRIFYKKKISTINTILRRLRSHPKDRVVQRLS